MSQVTPQTAALDEAPLDEALRQAFAAETRRGVLLAIAGRAVCFVLLWLSFARNAQWLFDNELLIYRSAIVLAALLSGLVGFLVVRRAADPIAWSYPVVLVDFVLAAALVFGWQPWYLADYPQFLAVRYQDVLFFVVVLSFAILPLSRRLPLLAAAAAALTWCAGVAQAWLRTADATTSVEAARGVADWPTLLARLSQPDVLNLDYVAVQVVGLIALGLLLTGAVQGARRSVETAVVAGRERDRLARFFPPAVLQAIAAGKGDLADRARTVAVLFVDFDRARQAAASMAALDGYFAACERIVFEHGGIVDRFAGDPVMASFGAVGGGDDGSAAPHAEAAVRCALALHRDLSAMQLGCAGVGLALGPAVVGAMGSERQHMFGVVGDTTNLASRMLGEARKRRLACVMADALARSLPAGATAGVQPLGPAPIRGFPQPIELWGIPA